MNAAEAPPPPPPGVNPVAMPRKKPELLGQMHEAAPTAANSAMLPPPPAPEPGIDIAAPVPAPAPAPQPAATTPPTETAPPPTAPWWSPRRWIGGDEPKPPLPAASAPAPVMAPPPAEEHMAPPPPPTLPPELPERATEPALPAPSAHMMAPPPAPAVDKPLSEAPLPRITDKAPPAEPVKAKEAKTKDKMPPPPIPPQPASNAGAAEPEGNKPDVRIAFAADDTTVPEATKSQLNELAARLKKEMSLRLSIVAHASGTSDQMSTARRVSLARALALRAYLIDQGVDNLRINVQAEGSKNAGNQPDRVDMFLLSGGKDK